MKWNFQKNKSKVFNFHLYKVFSTQNSHSQMKTVTSSWKTELYQCYIREKKTIKNVKLEFSKEKNSKRKVFVIKPDDAPLLLPLLPLSSGLRNCCLFCFITRSCDLVTFVDGEDLTIGDDCIGGGDAFCKSKGKLNFGQSYQYYIAHFP